MISLIALVASAFASPWTVREHVTEWERGLRSVPGGKEVVDIPPKLEYWLCYAGPAMAMTAKYTVNGIPDYIKLSGAGKEGFSVPGSCFVVDPVLIGGTVGDTQSFTVTGFLRPSNPYVEAKDIEPGTFYVRNGFLTMTPLPDAIDEQPNHLYSKTPPVPLCHADRGDHKLLVFEDRSRPEEMKAYAIGRKVHPLDLIASSPYQSATFMIPNLYYRDGASFSFQAVDPEKNRSKLKRLENIPLCD